MINFKPKIPAMLGALAVLTAGAAHAELLEYTFKAPDGTQRSRLRMPTMPTQRAISRLP